MVKKIGIILLLLAVTGVVQAQSNKKATIEAAIQQLNKAMIDGDSVALMRLSSPLLSYGHSSGLVQDQQEFVSKIVSGASDFVTIGLSEQTIAISGNTAIVRHLLSADTNDDGKPGTVKLKILLVWQQQKGQWKLLARQAVKFQ